MVSCNSARSSGPCEMKLVRGLCPRLCDSTENGRSEQFVTFRGDDTDML